jgi:hypothetical protein
MPKTIENLMIEALELPPQARAFIAEKLIESLDIDPLSDLSPKWKEEITKRCRETDEDVVKLRFTEAVFKKAFSSLK